ncbi:hypothetical protein COA23_20900 [Priestia megaterium]|nr:hypothetical protein COA23_20900 [Priestia megaterium]
MVVLFVLLVIVGCTCLK